MSFNLHFQKQICKVLNLRREFGEYILFVAGFSDKTMIEGPVSLLPCLVTALRPGASDK